MSSSARFSGLALLALALIGCGGNSGTQITSLSRSLDLDSGTTYADAAPVGTIGGTPVATLASFTTKKSQQVVVWGTRDDATGRIASVREMAYVAPGVAPLYATYNDAGGLAGVYDTDTHSSVTFSALEDSTVTCVGYDGTRDKTATVRATLSDVGVTLEVVDDGRGVGGRGGAEKRFVALSELAPPVAARGLPNDDPLAGLASAFRDSADRTRIVNAILKAAGIVVKAPFDGILRDVSGYMLLDRFTQSYGQYAATGAVPVAAPNGAATPLPYRP
jgi:hypothetical protein